VADEGAAAEQIVSGKTPWLPLSDLADYYLGFEFPGGGAAHQGKTVKPLLPGGGRLRHHRGRVDRGGDSRRLHPRRATCLKTRTWAGPSGTDGRHTTDKGYAARSRPERTVPTFLP